MYNIVLLCPDSLPMGVAKQAGSVDEMKQLFVGWDPMYELHILLNIVLADKFSSLTSFLDNVKEIDKWKLMHSESYRPRRIFTFHTNTDHRRRNAKLGQRFLEPGISVSSQSHFLKI